MCNSDRRVPMWISMREDAFALHCIFVDFQGVLAT